MPEQAAPEWVAPELAVSEWAAQESAAQESEVLELAVPEWEVPGPVALVWGRASVPAEALALELVPVLARVEAAQARHLVAKMPVAGWLSSRVPTARVPNWARPRRVRSGSLCRSRDLASPTGHRCSPSTNTRRSSARRW